MNVGLSTLYDIGSNYTIKLNDKEILVVEEDELRSTKKTPQQKLQIGQEKKAEQTKQSKDSKELSPDEKRLVGDLQSRDEEVKAHEAAHQSAGGGMAGTASYTYQQGPDGKMYAIGGEVSISTPAASTPEEAIANARTVAASAMAAGDPSPQDYSVASSARVMEMKAQQQLAKKQEEEISGKEVYAKEARKDASEEVDYLSEINISA